MRPHGQARPPAKIAECDRSWPSTAPRSTRAQTRPSSPRGSPRPQTEKAAAEAACAQDRTRRRLTEAQIEADRDRPRDMVAVLRDADPDDKAEIYSSSASG